VYRQVGKRALDVCLVTLFAPLWVPLWMLSSLAVLLLDGRPAHFRQDRIGRDEVPFTLLKLRTMSVGEGSDGERLTRVGAVLRKSSLDELPQLINVLRGDMSLVGPRPLFVRYLEFYTPRERRRHALSPGITGLAQTEGRNTLTWDERLELDVRYVDEVSLALDLQLLGRTALRILQREGVQVIPGEHQAPLDTERQHAG
jgi:lipopolysaccharide/colanic/teichoic acid biosynthesis glycosyltransferase